jgi:hypothetical protein
MIWYTNFLFNVCIIPIFCFCFQDLLQLGKFGDDGPDGNSTVFNVPTLIGIKKQNIMMDQAANPHVRSSCHP